MFRRRRPTREIPFSFDSFLDLVANVVGIIIRLILVVWVGARSYSSVVNVPPAAPELPVLTQPSSPSQPDPPEPEPPLPSDPLQEEIAHRRHDLDDVQARLLEQLRQLHQAQDDQTQLKGQLAHLDGRKQELQGTRTGLEQQAARHGETARTLSLSLEELQRRQQRLRDEMAAMEKLPPLGHVLRYQTPVSRPVQSDEVMFECHYGRVAYIDVTALLTDVRQHLEDKAHLLRTQWKVTDTAGPIGNYRLRYAVERQRDEMDSHVPDASPPADGQFRYGVSEWVVEPIAPVRGEPLPAALAKGSEFRQVTDLLDPQHAVVTFWVYPDSFAVYRQLRDYLYERDLVVAGRPLPEGVPIASSRRGTASRGQ